MREKHFWPLRSYICINANSSAPIVKIPFAYYNGADKTAPKYVRY